MPLLDLHLPDKSRFVVVVACMNHDHMIRNLFNSVCVILQ